MQKPNIIAYIYGQCLAAGEKPPAVRRRQWNSAAFKSGKVEPIGETPHMPHTLIVRPACDSSRCQMRSAQDLSGRRSKIRR